VNTVPRATIRWRKSSKSTAQDTCVELALVGLVRDSKNPGGPALSVDLGALLAAVKDDQLR
jgi:hypothetical protein